MTTLPPLLVWLDPGKLTGVAVLEESGRFHSAQFNFNGTMDELTPLCETFHRELWLGWEMYIVTGGGGKAGTPSYSLETIGMVKTLCRQFNVTVLPAQPAASRKLGGDDKLRRLGWWNPGHRHANDAANHLVAWLLRESMATPEVLDKLFPGTNG